MIRHFNFHALLLISYVSYLNGTIIAPSCGDKDDTKGKLMTSQHCVILSKVLIQINIF